MAVNEVAEIEAQNYQTAESTIRAENLQLPLKRQFCLTACCA